MSKMNLTVDVLFQVLCSGLVFQVSFGLIVGVVADVDVGLEIVS